MTPALVRLERSGGLATLYLDRPPVNAVDLELLARAEEVLIEVEGDGDVQSLVVTGTGASFSAGLDLKIVPRYSLEEQQRTVEAINRVVARLYALPLPVVAAVNGHAIAGGLVLALACDYRVGVHESCRIGLTEARAAIPFPAVAMAVVQAEVSPAVARRLTLMAHNYGSEAALGDGILDELQPRSAVVGRAQSLAADLGAVPRTTYARIKRQLRAPAIARHAEVLSGGDPLVRSWLSPETEPASAALLRDAGEQRRNQAGTAKP
jgi:enoyl-CoA hydratase